MSALSVFLPTALLVGLVALHAFYYWLHRHSASQHQVELPAAPDRALEARPAKGAFLALDPTTEGAPRRLEGEYAVVRKGRTPFAASAPAGAARPAVTAAPRFAWASIKLANRDLTNPLVCGDDLRLLGDCAFDGAVKVAGDLTINGRAVFREPVTVNGYVHVTGEAVFEQGLLTKSDAVVSGNLVIGSRSAAAWVVARKLRIEGGLALHGSVSTAHGVELEAA
ncbi:polymer-forming cytoskeletal protein [Phenylobacterium sp.]|jgi:cytoskeletal protein CcmA (bactofilin family)|uniref:polymer-forming cytoskeletal protein n=1 Tax=Phenylobacterium sp. TaxID=1871053 RepID=UPI002E375907|nr:polymer-forming cytoskeletal protein [Phenylobacterium sp.]HEX2560226.1 polymer-forming cytoskeletal protein [Phenylobacterium sp.]